ncbi:hypothetical protein ACLMJK_000714 [Lecanora helva]
MSSIDGPRKVEMGVVETYRRLLYYGSIRGRCLQVIATFAAWGAGTMIPLVLLLWGELANDFLRFARRDATYTSAKFQHEINKKSLDIVFLFLGKFVLSYIYMVFYTITAADIGFNLRVKYVGVVLEQDISTLDGINSKSIGGATEVINSISTVEIGLGDQLGQAVQLTAAIVSAFIISFARQWKLTLVVSTVIPLTVLTVAISVLIDVRLERKIQDIYEATSNIAKDALGNIKDVFASTAEAHIFAQYSQLLGNANKLGYKKAPAAAFQYSFELFFLCCGYALAFWYGSLLYSRGGVSIGSIITIQYPVLTESRVFFCVTFANSCMTGISVQIAALSNGYTAAKSIFELTENSEESSPADQEKISEIDNVRGAIRLKDVDFSYPARPDVRIYNRVTLEIPAGKTTAIIGASGCGKSWSPNAPPRVPPIWFFKNDCRGTIVALIQRWYDITGGQILLDEVDIRRLDVHWLRKQIGLVQQEPTLFRGTIFDNVERGLVGTIHENKSHDEKLALVTKACDIANAKDFISALPETYNTWTGGGGTHLSGGQRQRLAIARAIVGDPKILILDEATAALDAYSEEAVQAALDSASIDRTTICITHKAATAKRADRVIVFTRNGISEQGTPEELMAMAGFYAQFQATATVAKPPKREPSIETLVDPSTSRDALIKEGGVIHSDIASVNASDHRNYTLLECVLIIFYGQKRYWPWMAAVFIPCFFGGLLFAAEALLFGRMVNNFVGPVALVHGKTNFWALMFFVLALATLLIYGLIGFNGTVLTYKLSRVYRLQYLQNMLRQPMTFFDDPKNSAEILTAKLTQHPTQLQDLLGMNVALIIIILVNIVSCSILAIATQWKFGLVAVFGSLPPICIAGLVRVHLQNAREEENQRLYFESSGFAAEFIGAMRTVTSLCLENTLLSEYRTMLQKPLFIAKKMAFHTMIYLALADSLEIAGMALSFWYGGTLLTSRQFGLAPFFTVFAAVIFGGQATAKLFSFSHSFTKAKFAANHILALGKSTEVAATLPRIQYRDAEKEGTITFQRVSFKYPTRDMRILNDFSLEIVKGQRVALVGGSGCGKSTILSLLQRFYDPDVGSISLDGIRMSNLDVEQTRRQMAVVPQDHFLYRVPDSELQRACEIAAISDFVNSLPEGLSTACGGNGGVAFSGGQRQRLIIARALVRRPQILLLDEATSALDVESERLFTEALLRLPQETTVIAAAHRFSTIRDFDVIAVLDQGSIIELGSYPDLMSRRGRFYQMVSLLDFF